MIPSTANNGQHLLLKTSASGGPPGTSMITSNSVTSRANTADKIRSQTVRLPGSGVRRRETLDPVPGGMSIRKIDPNDKSRTPTGEPYVYFFKLACMLFVVFVCIGFLLVQILKVVYPVYRKGFVFDSHINQKISPMDLSSFNRGGFEASLSSNSSSQAPHHMMRGSARENPKSASLSAQQQTSKLQEKLKCVVCFKFHTNYSS